MQPLSSERQIILHSIYEIPEKPDKVIIAGGEKISEVKLDIN